MQRKTQERPRITQGGGGVDTIYVYVHIHNTYKQYYEQKSKLFIRTGNGY